MRRMNSKSEKKRERERGVREGSVERGEWRGRLAATCAPCHNYQRHFGAMIEVMLPLPIQFA